MIYNMNIQKKSQAKKPKDLFELPQDKIKINSGPKSTKEEYQAFLDHVEYRKRKSKNK